MCVSQRAWVGVLSVCMCVHTQVLAWSKAFCFLTFPRNRSARDSTLHLTNVQEPGAKQWHQLKGLSSTTPPPNTSTRPKPRVYVCVSITRPSNIARGHIVKYGTHTMGIYRYNGNGYGYQNLLHINAYAYWVRMHVINFVSLHISATGNYSKNVKPKLRAVKMEKRRRRGKKHPEK